MPRTSLVVAALLLLSEASAQLDPTTGYIKPTPGVPRFDPAAWNAAYKVTFRNMPLRRSPDQASDYHVQSFGCLATGFETQNVSAVTPVSRTNDGANFLQPASTVPPLERVQSN